MLATIVLFLALVSLGFTIVKYRIAIYKAKTRLNLTHFLIFVIITALLFSTFYYITH